VSAGNSRSQSSRSVSAARDGHLGQFLRVDQRQGNKLAPPSVLLVSVCLTLSSAGVSGSTPITSSFRTL